MRRPVFPLVLLSVLLPATAGSAAAQSAKAIMNRMLSEYEQRMTGVNDYTVTQEVMGTAVTMQFEKEMVDGHPFFKMRESSAAGMPMGGSRTASEENRLYVELPRLAERAKAKGQETVDGHTVHVVLIDDLSGLDLGQGMPNEFEPRTLTFYVDASQWIPRRLVFAGRMKTDKGPAEVTSTMDLLDYREVKGMLHPFLTRVRVDGLGQAIDPESRKQYEEMKKQLADMPESQRQMVEKMMKGKLDQMEKMMAGDGGMNFEIVVKELKVNTGG